jgi:hypothetical protein
MVCLNGARPSGRPMAADRLGVSALRNIRFVHGCPVRPGRFDASVDVTGERKSASQTACGVSDRRALRILTCSPRAMCPKQVSGVAMRTEVGRTGARTILLGRTLEGHDRPPSGRQIQQLYDPGQDENANGACSAGPDASTAGSGTRGAVPDRVCLGPDWARNQEGTRAEGPRGKPPPRTRAARGFPDFFSRTTSGSARPW